MGLDGRRTSKRRKGESRSVLLGGGGMTTRFAYTSFYGLHVNFCFMMLVDIDNTKV